MGFRDFGCETETLESMGRGVSVRLLPKQDAVTV